MNSRGDGNVLVGEGSRAWIIHFTPLFMSDILLTFWEGVTMRQIRILIAVVTLASGFFFSACKQTDRQAVAPPEKVTIAFSATHYAILADVAQVKNYFREEG